MQMNISDADKAQILAQALPHIQKYDGKVVVVKYGGNAMINEELKEAVMQDIVLLSLVGIRVVLVHGGGPDITAMLGRMGIESKFIGGLRYTDKETAEVAQMVLAGKTNKDLVALLGRYGGKALGFCGLDDKMLVAQKMRGEVDLGYVGEIVSVNPQPVVDALEKGYLPVIATVAGDEAGTVYNVNADTAAARIAAALGAEDIILMTDTPGLLEDKDDESTLIGSVNVSDVPFLIKKNVIQGGMIPKVACCVDAVRRGVGRAFIIDGRVPHAILIELLTNDGLGTMFF